MKFDLVRPCADCPFRSDGRGIPLHKDRVREITDSILLKDMTFSCHKTVDYDSRDDGDEGYDADEYVPGEGDQHCAGALLMILDAGMPNRIPRVAVMLDIWDPAKMRRDVPTYATAEEMIEAQD